MAVATAIAVAGVAVSAYGANQQSKAAKAANKQAKKTGDAQVDLGYEQLEDGRQRYRDWQERFNPIMDDLTDMANEDQRPDYGAIAADVGTAFGVSQEMNRRQMERTGVAPTDGAAAASESQYGIGRALALVGGNQSARVAAKDQRFQRLGAVYAMGNGLQSSAASGIGQGYANTQGALGNQAMFQMQQSQAHAQAAQAGASGVGYGLGQLAQNWGNWNQPTAPVGGMTVPNSPAWQPPASTGNGAAPWQTGQAPWNTGYGGGG